MSYLIPIIFILVIIILILVLRKQERVEKVVYKTRKTKHGERKEAKKEKILEFLKQKDKITNDQVQKLLGVSDAATTIYLDELEKEGKIKQIGKTGRSVYYKHT